MSQPLSSQQGIVLTYRRRFFLVRLPIALLFIGGSLLLVRVGRSGYERGVGWFAIFFFALLLLIGVMRLFDRRPQYWINGEGINCLQSSLGLIPWAEIQAAGVVEYQRQQFLCLYLNNPEQVLSRLSPPQRWLKQLNQGMGFGTISVALGSLEASPAEIRNYIGRYVPGPQL